MVNDEKALQKKFLDFLISKKNYKEENFLVEPVLSGDNESTKHWYLVDLILLDIKNNNYLAIIEFKKDFQTNKNYLKAFLRETVEITNTTNLPAYIITHEPDSKDEFDIYILGNDDFTKIDRNDFPNYETLSSKHQADEKTINSSLSLNKKVIRNKKKLYMQLAISLTASTVIAIVFTIISFISGPQNNKQFMNEQCCDSLEQKLLITKNKITNIENSLLYLKSSDSLSKYFRFIDSSLINKKIRNIEEIIFQSPEKIIKIKETLLEYQNMKLIIEHQKELNEANISDMNHKIDSLEKLTIGLIIAVFGALISFTFTFFRRQTN